MTGDEQSIRALIDQWHHAMTEGDVETVLGLMAEDIVFQAADQAPAQGRDTFGRGLRDVLSLHRIESTSDIHKVDVAGDLASVWATLTVRVVPRAGGPAVVRSGSALSVLRKCAGAWAVVRDVTLLSVVS